MEKIKIRQTKSGINCLPRQRKTLKALGITKMQQTVEHTATQQVLGMITKVQHLVTVEKV